MIEEKEAYTPTPRRTDEWLVRLIALLTAAMGVINLVSATFPALSDRLAVLKQVLPLEVRHGSHLAAALAGFALLLLAEALLRRKQVAWGMTIVILLISSISHLLKGLDYEEASLAFALMIILLVNRHHFHAYSDLPSARRGLFILLAAVGFTLAYGITGFYMLDRHFKVSYDFFAATRQTFVMFTQFYDPGLEPLTGFGRFFGDSIYVVAAGTVFYSLVMLIRPVLVHEPATAQERLRAREVVSAFGHTSLARMALFPDKHYFFSRGGSLFAFVPKGRVALVLGDPIGPAEDLPAALAEFSRFCGKNDWFPVYYQALPEHLEQYQSCGMEVLPIGQEAVVDLTTFTLEGKAGKDFRTVLNKMDRLGFRAQVYRPPLTDALLHELREISDEWLSNMHGREIHFATGWFDEEYLRGTPVVTVSAPDGVITAFANIIPEYQAPEMAVDLMRRRNLVEHGSMDFLFIKMLQWAREEGAQSFSLGLSALSGLAEASENLATERALNYIYENVNRFYNFKGLHAFKEKFSPGWQARYLVHPGLASLPAIGTALMRANTGDDFLSAYFFPRSQR